MKIKDLANIPYNVSLLNHSNKFYIKTLLLSVCFTCFILGSCNSEEKEQIEDFKSVIIQKNYHWVCKYDYYFEDFKLTCYEEDFFYKDSFKTIYTFFEGADALVKVFDEGDWDVEYNKKLDAFFLTQNYSRPTIKNLGMKEQYFEKFDTEYRADFFGDAYDSQNDEDEFSVENLGYEIIDWNDESFIIEDLEQGYYYKYHRIKGSYDPHKNTSNLINLYPNI